MSAIRTLIVLLGLLGAASPLTSIAAPSATSRVHFLPIGPTRCVNVPVNPAEIEASSCWVTSSTSIVVAGTDPMRGNDGVVVLVNDQHKTRVALPAAGAITIDSVIRGHACVTTRNAGSADVDLSARTVRSATPTACAQAASSTTHAATPAGAAAPSIPATATPSGPAVGAAAAPVPASSYYVHGAYVSECGTSATTGCPLYVDGANEPAPSGGALMVLDFGAPCYVPSSSPALYGSELFDTTDCFTGDQLLPLAQAFIRGYESTHGSGTPVALLGLGTNNSVNAVTGDGQMSVQNMQAAGQSWYTSFVSPLAATPATPAPITIWAASDQETDNSSPPLWYGPLESRAWVDAYGAAAGITTKSCAANSAARMADYGSDPFLNKQWSSPGPNTWTMADVYHVAWGAAVACAVPEIYYSVNATEWQQLSQAAVGQGLPAITFSGPMAANWDNGTLAPADSWTALANATGQSPPYLTVISSLFPPSAPTGVVAIPSDGSATVYWSASSVNGGSPVTSYTVTASGGGAPGPSVTVSGQPPPTSAVVSGLSNGTAYTFTVAATSAAGPGPASSPSDPVTPGRGPFHSLVPARILDTRPQSQVGPYGAPLGAGGTIAVQVTGQGNVPSSGVQAVVLNVTVTNPTMPSFLAVWPAGIPRPLASNLNFTPGTTVPNLVEVALGSGGQVNVYNAAGSTDVIIDVAGYVSTPTATQGVDGLYNPVVPDRVLDTRYGTGGYTQPVDGGQTINVQVGGVAGSNIPASHVSAVVLNVTATQPNLSSSFLTVFPMGATRPLASNLNFVIGQTVPNRVIVKVGTNPQTGTSGWISIYNQAGSVHVIVDVAGWYTDGTDPAATGSAFVGMAPVRLMDTRNGHGPVGAGGTMTLPIGGQSGIPTSATAVVLNVTVTNPTAASFLTVWPDGPTRPFASDLNYEAGLTVPNLVVAKVGSNGSVDFYNAAGSADVIVDVVGWYQ